MNTFNLFLPALYFAAFASAADTKSIIIKDNANYELVIGKCATKAELTATLDPKKQK
ncbi:hypothetical protein DSO57_1035094 [Entomophthora muscae]|uniref:Uncharacterized protein n=1 Tax=Entomophthora muscae TaxID=34485 RepID=A0ACC2S1L6_9FUNG|nr:hypothetical protein DSO57_1035094 [Entomophthora muscae]